MSRITTTITIAAALVGTTQAAAQSGYSIAEGEVRMITGEASAGGALAERGRIVYADGAEASGGGYTLTGARPPAAPACPADFDGDERVDATDLATLITAWGQGGVADLDGDGEVAAPDLGVLLSAWGACD